MYTLFSIIYIPLQSSLNLDLNLIIAVVFGTSIKIMTDSDNLMVQIVNNENKNLQGIYIEYTVLIGC